MYKMTDTDKIIGTGGILNVGFTCYANAVIQAFRHCTDMNKIFAKGSYTLKSDCKYNNLTDQFANVIQTLGEISSNSTLRPLGFWNAFDSAVVNTCFDHLAHREPHDAHEFLMFLLDVLHESLSKPVAMKISNCPLKSEKQIFHAKSLNVWISSFQKQYSPFVPLYFGLFHIQITCVSCGHSSNNWETFNTLKGVINKSDASPTLLQTIEGELNTETIDDYACDKCAPKRSSAVRSTRVWKLPKTLIIVLKRFTPDGRKIHTPITPISNVVEFNSIFSESSPEKKQHTCYTVRSIVDHHGSSRGGHYTAQAKHHKEDAWYNYDDQNVSKITNPHYGESTYILFLEQC